MAVGAVGGNKRHRGGSGEWHTKRKNVGPEQVRTCELDDHGLDKGCDKRQPVQYERSDKDSSFHVQLVVVAGSIRAGRRSVRYLRL